MKNIKYIILFFFLFSFYSQSFAGDLLYPIQKMSKPACRFQDYATLDADCIQDLPILHTADYSKYKNDYSVYRRVYTVLWGSSYTYGWDVGNGGHEGVDIATAKGTPVRAMTDGKVVKAKTLAGRGNTVKVEHTINGRIVYSDYSHLSVISVKEGDVVKAGDKLGEVGSTGNSTGNHLHFQIDVVKAGGPWYRTKCSEKDYNKIVNSSVCFSELNAATVDPLLFLETNGAVVKSATVIDKPKQENISTVGLISNEEILKKEINEFLEKYDLKLEIQNLGGNIELGKSGTLRVTVTDKLTKKPFNGNFPGTMTFKYDDKKLSVFPTGIYAIDKGIRDITITPKQAGNQTIDVYIGQASVTKVSIGVLDPKKSITPYSTEFSLSQNNVISEIKKGSFYFKTKDGISILGSAFNGTYTLSSSDGTLKFCIKKAQTYEDIDYVTKSTCSEFDFIREASFSFKDTTEGILLFDYKITGSEKTNLIIKNQNGGQISFASIQPVLPSGITTSYPYYSEMIEMGKVGVITGVNQGYYMQDRELVFSDALGYIRNTLAFLKTNCKTDVCKTTINTKIESLKKANQTKYSQIKINRIQFTQLVKMFIPSTGVNGTPVAFRDLDNNQQSIVGQVLKTYTWKDNFGQTRYFQPTKSISRGEAAYVIYNYIK